MAKSRRKKSGTQVVSSPGGSGRRVTKSSTKTTSVVEDNQEEEKETLELVKGEDFFFLDPTSTKGKAVKEVQQKKPIYENEKTAKGIATDTIWLDYDSAKEFYLEHKGKNRKLGMGDIKNYAAQYINGEWCLTDQGISIDWDGCRVNGEHRLQAIFYAKEVLGCDVSIPFRVTYGLEPRSFEKYDQLRKRSGADVLDMEGHPNAKTLQEAVRHHSLRQNSTRIKGGKALTISQLQDHLKKNKALVKATNWVMDEVKNLKVHWSLGHTAAMLTLARQNRDIPEGAFEEFLLRLADAECCESDTWNPAYVTKEPEILSKAIARKIFKLKEDGSSMDRDTKVDWMVAAFNSYINPKAKPTKAAEILPPKGVTPSLGGKDFPEADSEE